MGANTGSRLHVYIVADTTLKTVDIASVSGNTITLKAGQTITTAVGDKVYRGAYGVANSCTVKPSNQYTLTTADQKHTCTVTRISCNMETRDVSASAIIS